MFTIFPGCSADLTLLVLSLSVIALGALLAAFSGLHGPSGLPARLLLFVRQWNEGLLLPLGIIIIWPASERLLRLLDPLAAPFDVAVLQKFLYAAIGCLSAHFIGWLLLKLSFPALHRYLYRQLQTDILSGTPENEPQTTQNPLFRICCSLSVFACYLLTYVAILFSL